MFDSCVELEAEFSTLEKQLADPAVHADQDTARRLGRRYAAIRPVVHAYREWLGISGDKSAALELVEVDPAFAAEVAELTEREEESAERLRTLLLPRDPLDDNDIIIEVKSGEGGDASALFAGDLARMYMRYAERRGWSTEVLDSDESDLGGYKNIAIAVKARGVPEPGDAPYARLKFEGGVHRVQRVPVTESQGRIHTSAAGVLVLPEAEEVDVVIDPNDLRIDVYRSSGPGGQSVNTTDSAVRITHIPTGIVCASQAERSQFKNKATAMKQLKNRLYNLEAEKQAAIKAALDATKQDVSFGSQIRSYVFQPYTMVNDHRTELKLPDVHKVMDGAIDPFIEAYLKQQGGPGDAK